MDRTTFEVDTATGRLGGWRAGAGPRVLVLHGGPGLGYGYLDAAVVELAQGYEVATFQQRGLAPSTSDGDLDVPEAVADVVAVLDHLGWETAALMGHSWGGHLALHVAVSAPGRLAGALMVDTLGAVGDGGGSHFGAELVARVPEERRARLHEIQAREEAGLATDEEVLESLEILWPSYVADASAAPPMPEITLSQEASGRLMGDAFGRLPELEAALPSITVPCGFVFGERSPMPATASTDTADRIPGAWAEAVRGAGHFTWIEDPGSVKAGMDRLLGVDRARELR